MNDLDPEVFKVITPIKVDMLEYMTRDHPNRQYVDYVLAGLRTGFRYGFRGKRRKIIQDNLPTIDEDLRAFEEAIYKVTSITTQFSRMIHIVL